jgi:hypothetical protein
MVRNRESSAGRVPENDVATRLMIKGVPDFAESSDGVRASTNRETAHTETSMTASVIGAGIGSPCFFKLSR